MEERRQARRLLTSRKTMGEDSGSRQACSVPWTGLLDGRTPKEPVKSQDNRCYQCACPLKRPGSYGAPDTGVEQPQSPRLKCNVLACKSTRSNSATYNLFYAIVFGKCSGLLNVFGAGY